MIGWLSRLRCSTSRLAVLWTTLLLLLLPTPGASAQTDDLSDTAADPVRLFERGQNAHARGETERALEFYDEALKLRPEFPEAEFQRGSVLVSLGRFPEAESAFRRAIELRKDWSLPYSSLGTLLIRTTREKEAKTCCAGQSDLTLITMLLCEPSPTSDCSQDPKRLRTLPDAPPQGRTRIRLGVARSGRAWSRRSSRGQSRLDHAPISIPPNIAALVERADLRAAENDDDRAISDLKRALELKPNDKSDPQIATRLLNLYERTGKTAEADLLAKTLGIVRRPATDSAPGTVRVVGTTAEIEAANNADPAIARKALEALLEKNPRNAMLLAKLGASYRVDDPPRSLDFYRRANEVEPKNSEYATGYAAALVQARRFADAVSLLRQVTAAVPDSFVAHANLATALYELRRFAEALPEYQWLLSAKPDLVVANFFIGTSHDKLGEFEDALSAYQTFLAQADAKTNQLEIEKVQLRLPSLKKQIQLKQGVKHSR
jgi:tetratricopeptide (TPR) repeat protein